MFLTLLQALFYLGAKLAILPDFVIYYGA